MAYGLCCMRGRARIPSPARGSEVLCAKTAGMQCEGMTRFGSASGPLLYLDPPPCSLWLNFHTMEAPVVFIRGKRPAGERPPCLLDTLDLGALHVTSAKLHKKTVIALTRWRVWNPATTVWLTKSVVRLQMFAADKAMNYCDTRIQHQGRLMDWKTYTDLGRQ